MRPIVSALACVLLAILASRNAVGQQPIPLRAEDLLDARQFGFLSPVQFSPDGKWLAFAVVGPKTDADKKTVHTPKDALNTGVPLIVVGQDIWLADAEGEVMRNLTAGRGSNWAPKWSPDGHYLAFLSDRDGGGQPKVWIWDTEKNELRKVSDVYVRAEEIQWMADSKSLLVTLLAEQFTPAEYAEHLSRPSSLAPEEKAPRGSTVLVYRSTPEAATKAMEDQSGPWSLDYALRDLAKVGVQSGSVERIETSRRITSYAISPDGAAIAFTSPKRFERAGSQQTVFDIFVLDLHSRTNRTVASDIRLDLKASAFSWSPDSSFLAYHVGGIDGDGDLYIVDTRTGETRIIRLPPNQRSRDVERPPLWDLEGKFIYFISQGAIWRAAVENTSAAQFATVPERRVLAIVASSRDVLWSPDGGKSIVAITDDSEAKQSGFCSIDLKTGTSTRLLEHGQCYVCALQPEFVAVSSDGRTLAYFANDAEHDIDLWLTTADFRRSQRITHLNPQFDKYQMGSGRLIQWSSLDGEPLKGALLLPASYEAGKRYPLIVSVYGGASRSDHLHYFGLDVGVFNFQLLATRGYAVLLPDAPQHLGTPMGDLAKTVLPGVNKAVEMGIADPERLGIIGHSYGGYSALALIAQTQRFKAGVMSAGYGDLVASYGEMADDGTAYGIAFEEGGQGLMGGTPWQFRDRYVENSPIFYLDRITTPLLIVHGGGDRAVDPFLSAEVFVGLRRLRKEVEYAEYRGEDHAELTWSYENQLDYCERMIGWFDLHLKGRAAASK